MPSSSSSHFWSPYPQWWCQWPVAGSSSTATWLLYAPYTPWFSAWPFGLRHWRRERISLRCGLLNLLHLKVCFSKRFIFFTLLMVLTNVCSSIAVDMRIVPHHHLSLIPHVPTRSLLRIWEVVLDHYLRSEITFWTWSSREPSVSSVRCPSQSSSGNLADKKCRHRRPTHPHDINPTQGSQGEGKIPTYRWEEWSRFILRIWSEDEEFEHCIGVS